MYHLHIKSDGAHVRIHTASGTPILKRSFTINPSGGRGTWELRASSGVVVRRFKRATKLRAIERALKEIESAEVNQERVDVGAAVPPTLHPPTSQALHISEEEIQAALRELLNASQLEAQWIAEERSRIRPITEEPTFPCWLFSTSGGWWRCAGYHNRAVMVELNSHWMPNQPTRPTVMP